MACNRLGRSPFDSTKLWRGDPGPMRRVLIVLAAAAAVGLLAACETVPVAPVIARPAPPPPPPPPPPTPAEEFAWSTGRGPNTLTVAINYQPAAGQAWSCTGLA